MIDVLKQSALLLEQLIGLLVIAEKSSDLYALEVVGFSVPAGVPGQLYPLLPHNSHHPLTIAMTPSDSEPAWRHFFLKLSPPIASIWIVLQFTKRGLRRYRKGYYM